MENVPKKPGPPATNPEAIEKQEERTASIGEKSDTSSVTNTDQITPTPHPNPPLSLSRTSSKRSNVLARVASRITTRSIKDPGPPPDGGLVAWTQVLCAWFAVMNTWGFVNSFGAFQPYYESILPESASTISWIGSVQAALLFALGMFSGRALDRGWFRPTVLLGIVFQVIGIFSMSAATTFWQLLLTQGLCTGIGGGILFVPVMGLCSTYFSSNRGVALGIVTTGNSVGGVVYPLVVRQLLPRLGFGWAVRVLGFVNVVSMAVVVAFMKPRLPPRRAGPLVDWESVRDVPYVLHVIGMCFFVPPVYCVFYYVSLWESVLISRTSNPFDIKDVKSLPYQLQCTFPC
ncbi:MFS general substrate transporter [Pyrenochaeta sp. DS3sAY3a]|nr:MFS general substrate transporter [Pyrenochaeta sp. DS3sAY3a]